jgi:4-cresol dehydrogenase (hydroxylating) flavoprotein subunit
MSQNTETTSLAHQVEWLSAFNQQIESTTDSAFLENQLQNTSHFEPPHVEGWVQPKSVEDIQLILRQANENITPVYPYSLGLNWGLGSRLPVEDGCVLLDLSQMNKIIRVESHFHYAVIEPGVTQQAMFEHLKNNNLGMMLNVTGSSPAASIVGNMLERGSGFLKHKIEDLLGLEVVLPNGNVIKTGFWAEAEEGRDVTNFKYGVGPDLTGLFCQGNFGVVTKAVVRLYPNKQVSKMLWCKLDQVHLPEFVENIARLFQEGHLHSVMHIGNDKRMKIENQNLEDTSVWTGMCKIGGRPGYINWLETELKQELSPLCIDMQFFGEHELPDENLAHIYGCHVGKPTDFFVRAMYQSVGETLQDGELDIDKGRIGMLCCLPVLPAKADAIKRAAEILDEVAKSHGIMAAGTFNPIDGYNLEAVINLYFDRRKPEEVKQAHAANDALHDVFHASGFKFYRLDVKNMHRVFDYKPLYWETLDGLKKSIDPNGIISPGRYQFHA